MNACLFSFSCQCTLSRWGFEESGNLERLFRFVFIPNLNVNIHIGRVGLLERHFTKRGGETFNEENYDLNVYV